MTPQPRPSSVGSSVPKIGGCPIVKYSTQIRAVIWSWKMPYTTQHATHIKMIAIHFMACHSPIFHEGYCQVSEASLHGYAEDYQLMGFQPVFPGADFNLDGHVHRQRRTHCFANDRHHGIFFRLQHVEHQFVMHGQ